ncbi:MAG: ABC transporter permease [Promethearchaeota archaeon]
MHLVDIIKFSGSSIKTQKSRTMLTVLGVLIGIAAIVGLLALSNGFKNSMTEQFETGFSTKVIQVTSGSGGMFGGGSSSDSDFTLILDDQDTIESIEHVETAMPVVQKMCTVVIDGEETSISVYGVSFETYNYLYSSFEAEKGGIPLNVEDEEFVIGYYIHSSSNNDTTIYYDVGDDLTIKWSTREGTTFVEKSYKSTVAAVISEIGGMSMGGGPSDNGIYIQLDLASEIFDTDEVSSFQVLLDDDSEEIIKAVSEDIEEIFQDQVSVMSSTALLKTMEGMFSTMEIFLGGIAGIALLVAGIGIMNIMIVSILERTREIGILKSLGLKNRSILLIFLFESIMIGLIGSVLGILAGWGFSNVLMGVMGGMMGDGESQGPRMPSMIPVIDIPLILQALFFGIGVAVIFGLYPAWRASRLEPVKALRYE